MPSNIEIKARVRDFEGIRRFAETISDVPCEVLPQEDTFFKTPRGRLKLREISGRPAQLIYYERPDQEGPKRSNYQLFATQDPENLKRTLELAYGIRGVVRKTRYLYMAGQTRIHLDDVEGLGHFMELEVVLNDDQTDLEGEGITRDLMSRLGIQASDLLDAAYMDMLEKNPSGV
jgi:predicted adenylyl cyclase CyaB